MSTRGVRSLAFALLTLAAAAPAGGQNGPARIAARLQAAPVAWTAPAAALWNGGTVTLKMDGVPLEAALQEIARQAQLRLTYSRESLPERRVSAHAEQIRASEAFALVLDGTGLQAVPMASGRVTIVRRAPAVPAAVDAAPAPRPAAVEAPAPAAPAARADVHLSVQAPRYAPAEVLAGTIHGRVTEAGSGRGLGGAQVAIAGSQRSAVTNAGGDYTLGAVP
ncbi:MAG: hypothetical protein ACJ8J0_22090, partial [Longimicrobiaceae bacterium]